MYERCTYYVFVKHKLEVGRDRDREQFIHEKRRTTTRTTKKAGETEEIKIKI